MVYDSSEGGSGQKNGTSPSDSEGGTVPAGRIAGGAVAMTEKLKTRIAELEELNRQLHGQLADVLEAASKAEERVLFISEQCDDTRYKFAYAEGRAQGLFEALREIRKGLNE